QAEDGIRARNVTGVQTCALPILLLPSIPATVSPTRLVSPVTPRASATPITPADMRMMGAPRLLQISLKVIILVSSSTHTAVATKIGRASCREGEEAVGGAQSR